MTTVMQPEPAPPIEHGPEDWDGDVPLFNGKPAAAICDGEHDLGDPVVVRSEYRPVTDLHYSTIRHCRRCPASFMTVPR